MRRLLLGLVAMLVTVGGCASARLVPAPGTVAVPGPGAGAITEAARVRVVARAGAWQGVPRGLELSLTPVLVMLENNGTRPVRVRHQDFALVGAGGRRYAAHPPFEIRGTVAVPVEPPYPAFYAGPPLRYRSRWYYRDPFWNDPFWYPGYAPRFAYVPLPTGDMIQQALPEATLAPGGRTSGFVYFPVVRKKDDPSVTFTATLVDARTSTPFATATIPFTYTD